LCDIVVTSWGKRGLCTGGFARLTKEKCEELGLSTIINLIQKELEASNSRLGYGDVRGKRRERGEATFAENAG